jgi:hypothetical protein
MYTHIGLGAYSILTVNDKKAKENKNNNKDKA